MSTGSAGLEPSRPERLSWGPIWPGLSPATLGWLVNNREGGCGRRLVLVTGGGHRRSRAPLNVEDSPVRRRITGWEGVESPNFDDVRGRGLPRLRRRAFRGPWGAGVEVCGYLRWWRTAHLVCILTCRTHVGHSQRVVVADTDLGSAVAALTRRSRSQQARRPEALKGSPVPVQHPVPRRGRKRGPVGSQRCFSIPNA